jgi:nitroreductase
MDFFSVLKHRHSVRAFKEDEIEKEKVDRIIAAAMLAPSAGNLQAYLIFVVKNKEAKKKIASACYGQDFVAIAPLLLVFCADRERSYQKYEERGYELYSTQDATIAAAYAQLAAAAEGLGSVWVGAFDPLEVSRIMELEPHVVPVVLLPVGYAAEQPRMRERRPVNEIVKEI